MLLCGAFWSIEGSARLIVAFETAALLYEYEHHEYVGASTALRVAVAEMTEIEQR